MAVSMQTYKFTLSDLLPGYVVKMRNGEIRKVLEIGNKNSKILLRPDGAWEYVSKWNLDMTASAFTFGDLALMMNRVQFRNLDIIEVYGHVNSTEHYWNANTITTEYRPLLWSRTSVKKMTVSEIEKKLGYKIEIVSEEEK